MTRKRTGDFVLTHKDLLWQRKVGQKIEMEHTSNKNLAAKIAEDHIREFKGKNYYKALIAMEKRLKR